jgi:hypothetical protein
VGVDHVTKTWAASQAMRTFSARWATEGTSGTWNVGSGSAGLRLRDAGVEPHPVKRPVERAEGHGMTQSDLIVTDDDAAPPRLRHQEPPPGASFVT